MALVLNKEDGSGKPDANSYADVSDGDAYFEGHLYAAGWSGVAEDRRAAALVMATRLIDSQFQFNGFRAQGEQALQWPRERCPDPDKGLSSVTVLGWPSDNWVEADLVPVGVVQATCEMARELLIGDRTAAPAGEGVDMISTVHAAQSMDGSGSSDSATTRYCKSDTRPILPRVVQAMLSKFGALAGGGSGAVRLVRV